MKFAKYLRIKNMIEESMVKIINELITTFSVRGKDK